MQKRTDVKTFVENNVACTFFFFFGVAVNLGKGSSSPPLSVIRVIGVDTGVGEANCFYFLSQALVYETTDFYVSNFIPRTLRLDATKASHPGLNWG